MEELADLVDGVRVTGGEPPDPFVWFTLICDDAEVDALVTALQALPMVVFAGATTDPGAGRNHFVRHEPRTAFSQTQQFGASPSASMRSTCWQVAGGAGDGVRIVDIEVAAGGSIMKS